MTASSRPDSAPTFLALIWGSLCALVLAAPLLLASGPATPAALIYLFFSPLCHQQPERSFLLLGNSLAVCHRCFGIYLGLLAGSFFRPGTVFVFRFPAGKRILALAGAAPLLLDALLPLTGLWTGSAASRFITGLFFGMTASMILTAGMSEIFSHLSSWRVSFRTTHAKGGVS